MTDPKKLAEEVKRLADKMMRDSWAAVHADAWKPAAADLHAAIDQLSALAEKAEQAWRQIESAPKDDGSLLIADAVAGAVGESHWIGDSWWTLDGDRWVSPTHWRPLPAPPAALSTGEPK
jgi:hypothetical protein